MINNENVMNAELFTQMVKNGAYDLDANRATVNDLNVFPIPDGDTGDNMYMTFSAGLEELRKSEFSSVSDAASVLSRGMLFGARGNSGVILSRIFAGISKGLRDRVEVDPAGLDEAMKSGVKEAYSSVADPVEGTILTVFREGVEYASSKLGEGSTLGSYFEDLTNEMRRSLDRTPLLLDVLREAGVVDSGGAGLLYITEGMRNALNGGYVEREESASPAMKTVDVSRFTENDVLSFGYCTEFLLRLTNSKVDVSSFDENVIRDWLISNGESVVCFRDGSIVKVHVHVPDPGKVLTEMRKYGEFLTIKIENMNLQHNEVIGSKEKTVELNTKKHKKYGIVAVASGEGIKETFLSLGVDEVVDGGQSMNPSAESLLRAYEKVNADTVLVFPNNSNVILTARQAAELYTKSDVRVICTKSVGECYSAVSMLDTSSNDTDEIVEQIKEVIGSIRTGAVSEATRDSQKDGINVKAGDFIGFSGDTILDCADTRADALYALCDSLGAETYDIMLLICGKNAPENEVDEIKRGLEKKYPKCELYIIDGGQPIFDYLVTLE